MRGPSAKAALAIVVAAFLVSCAGDRQRRDHTHCDRTGVGIDGNLETIGKQRRHHRRNRSDHCSGAGRANHLPRGRERREPTCTDEAGVFVESRGGRRLAAARPRGHRNRRHAVCDPLVSRRFRVGKRHAGRGGWRRHLPSTLVLEGQSDEGVFTRESPETLSWTVPRFACRHWTRAFTRATAGHSFRHQPYVTSSPSRVSDTDCPTGIPHNNTHLNQWRR